MNVDLKDFIRELVNTLPKKLRKGGPVISLEFGRDLDSGRSFYSRIDIYRIESLKILWYRYSEDNVGAAAGVNNLSEWRIPAGEYSVVGILPPVNNLSKSIFRTGNSLAVIQVI